MKKCEFTLLVLLSATVCSMSNSMGDDTDAAPTTGDFYVAPSGSDANPGTLKMPFATLTRARNAVRERIAAALDADVRVLIRGGVYQQAETLTFGPEDSGTDAYSITYAAYPGEKVVLSGGQRIIGWKKGENEIWTAEIPDVKAGKWYFRQLFVNGRRAYRARMPDRDAERPWWTIVSSSIERKSDSLRLPIPPPEGAPITLGVSGPIQAWRNLPDVELVWIHNHATCRKRLASVAEASQTFVLQPPHIMAVPPEAHSPGAQHGLPSVEKACYIENAIEFLTRPGQWYLDRRSGALCYWPREGEDLSQDEVVAPRVQGALIAVTGRRERPVQNLHFSGLHLQYVDYPLPDAGYFVGWIGQLWAILPESNSLRLRWMDAALQFEDARHCSFSDGGIAHVGGMGVTLADGTAHIAIEGNDIHDLGGGGIGAGTSRGKNITSKPYTSLGPIPREWEYRGYRIANNYIHHCGADYFDAVGIVAVTISDSTIAHNLVHDVAYSGIVMEGYVPNDEPARAGNNTIEFNHVYNAMQVCNDGACIYVVLPQSGRGATIRGNLVHDSKTNPHNGRTGHSFGVYLDVESKNYHLQDNVAYNCANGPLHFCGAKREDNTWSDNVFQAEGTPPQELLEAMQARAGLEPAYRRSVLTNDSPTCTHKMSSGLFSPDLQ